MWSGSIRKWPRRVERDADQPRPSLRPPQGDGPAGQAARAASSGCGPRATASGSRLRVAQRVGHAHPVADVAVQLADRVAGLEVGQAEADEDVRPADDEDAEVEQVEQERLAGRERRDDQDRGDGQRLESSEHRRRRSRRVGRPVGARRSARPEPRCGTRVGAPSGRRPVGRIAVDRRSSRGSRARPGRPARRGSTSSS